MAYTVYKHTSPSGKVYIGITGQTTKQRWGYNGNGYRYCPYFWRAIQKYGWENIEHEILYEGLTEEEACEMEVKLIAEYNATDPAYGYNDLIGGTSGKHGRPYTEEQLRKMSEATKKLWADPEYRQRLSDAHKGKVLPPEQRQKMSEAHKGQKQWNEGVPLTEEHKAKLSRIMKEIGNRPPSWEGKHHTEESKRKIGEAHKGFNPFAQKPMTEEHYKAFREASVKAASKPIRQLTKDGEIIAEYKSGKEAANALGLKSQSNITRCACGGLPHAYGYKWEYISEVSNGN